ncbi:MAG: hypothetical protein LRZ85_00415 [Alphaproteobacteria bacterium]|nr:hypothetical protein [Alphaproteobacteria bacterium]MCD8570967.1 hypothetical protein [Alphaproteobacteria bacterium]
MTADIVKDQITQGRIKAKISEFGPKIGQDLDGPSGFELSRLQNFLEGRQDIFDVLEQHAANHEKADPIPRKTHGDFESAGMFELLMDDLKDEFSRIAGFCSKRFAILKKGIHLI